MISVKDTGAQVILGRAGENIFRKVHVDATAWLAEYPTGEITGVFHRPDGVIYQVPLKQKVGVLTWQPTATDTYPGWGLLELRIRIGEKLGKSAVIRTLCIRSIQHPVSDEPPSDLPSGAEEGQVLTWTADGANWKDMSTIVEGAVEDYLEKNPSDGGVNFTTDETLRLDPETGVLSVNTADDVEVDNTLPITSAAVYKTVGNIEALLGTI